MAGPSNPAHGGDEGGGGANSDGPPRALGVRELVSGMIEGLLHVRHSEPFVPDRESPVTHDRGMRFEGGVEGTGGAINCTKREHWVLAGCSGRGSRSNFDSGAV